MKIQGTGKLAEAVWKARFGKRNVDDETSVQIWLCAENFLSGNEGSLIEDSFESTGNVISSIAPARNQATLGITHQDVADEAHRIWERFDHDDEQDMPAEFYWFDAVSILQRRERE